MALIVASTSGLVSLEVETGNLVKSFKQNESAEHGLVLLNNAECAPLSLLALQADRPVINHYQLKKEAISKRIILPAKMAAISVSPNGNWIAAGSQNGSLYIWSLLSGELKTLATEAHFQKIQTISWSKDSSCLVSGGGDSRVLVWRLIDLISADLGSGVLPRHVLSSHTLPIKSCVIGAGSFREARLYSASEDATVCVFDLYSGRLLYTLATDVKLNAMVVDPAERVVYLGSEDGVRVVPLYQELSSSKLSAVGSGIGGVISIGSLEHILKPECAATSSLALSVDGAHLFIGCEDGSISIWETGSGQLVKKFRPASGQVLQMLYSSKSLNADGIIDEIPILQKSLDTALLDFMPTRMATSDMIQKHVHDTSVTEQEMDDIDTWSSHSSSTTQSEDRSSSPGPVAGDSIPAELEQLKARHAQLQKMYDGLWAKHSAMN